MAFAFQYFAHIVSDCLWSYYGCSCMSLFVTDYEMLIVIQLILLFTMLSQIGIDIEENKRKTAKNVLSLADRFFTPSEFDYLVNIPDPDAQEKEFIKLWTLKVSKNFSDPIFKSNCLYAINLCYRFEFVRALIYPARS